MRQLDHFPVLGPVLNRVDYFQYDDDTALRSHGKVRPPSKLSAEQAAIGLIQISRIERDLEKRIRTAKVLAQKAISLGWRIPAIDWNNTRPSFVRFPAIVQDRRYWLKVLGRNGIDGGEWFNHPLHPAGSNFKACGYEVGMCPNAEFISSRIINLPVHPRCSPWISNRIANLALDASVRN